MSSDAIFTIFIHWGIPQAAAWGEFSLANQLGLHLLWERIGFKWIVWRGCRGWKRDRGGREGEGRTNWPQRQELGGGVLGGSSGEYGGSEGTGGRQEAGFAKYWGGLGAGPYLMFFRKCE